MYYLLITWNLFKCLSNYFQIIDSWLVYRLRKNNNKHYPKAINIGKSFKT